MCLLSISMSFWEKCPFWVLSPFLNHSSFCCWAYGILYIFYILILCHIYDLEIFFSFLWAAFFTVDSVFWYKFVFVLFFNFSCSLTCAFLIMLPVPLMLYQRNHHQTQCYEIFFLFFAPLVFELRASHLLGRCSVTWTTPLALFCVEYFEERISQTICQGLLQTMILLISASWVARIIGMSHQCLALMKHFFFS
jgi:hypothetical protein